MLNKDEYNQEEYNDYYRQEIEGAELNNPFNNDESGGRGKVIGLIILIALAVAGYFGYKMMNKSEDDIDTSLKVSMDNLPQSIQSESEPESDNEAITEENENEETQTANESKIDKDEVTNQVKQAVASSTKISPEEVAAIISAVMQQIDQEKPEADKTTPTVTKQDKELLNKLSTTEVDSVTTDLENALENINLNEDTQVKNDKKQVDVYNKVTIQESTGTDSLSQLSAQISNEIKKVENSSGNTVNQKQYEKEVISRKKEMRIIIVKKGDTLGKLAQRAYGNVMEYKRIFKANPEIIRPDRIYVGQKIRIPLD